MAHKKPPHKTWHAHVTRYTIMGCVTSPVTHLAASVGVDHELNLQCPMADWMKDWMNELKFIYAHKNTHKTLHVHGARYTECIHIGSYKLKFIYAHKNAHKTLHVHGARYTECTHIGSYKLKLPKDIHTSKVQTAPTHPHLPESSTMLSQLRLVSWLSFVDGRWVSWLSFVDEGWVRQVLFYLKYMAVMWGEVQWSGHRHCCYHGDMHCVARLHASLWLRTAEAAGGAPLQRGGMLYFLGPADCKLSLSHPLSHACTLCPTLTPSVPQSHPLSHPHTLCSTLIPSVLPLHPLSHPHTLCPTLTPSVPPSTLTPMPVFCLSLSLCISLSLSLCISLSLPLCISLSLSLCISLSVSLCISLCLCVFICLCLCVFLCLCLSVFLCLCLSVFICLCLSVFLSLCLCLCLPVLSVSVSLYFSVSVSLYFSLCLLNSFLFSFSFFVLCILCTFSSPLNSCLK